MLKLNEGQFVKIIGTTLKGENDIYIVTRKKSEIDYTFDKVKLDGTPKDNAYSLFFYDEDSINQNPNMQIEIVADLKKAKKEVNEYLKNLNNNEIVVAFEKSENQEVKENSIIRFTKSCEIEGKYMCKNTLWKVHFVKFQVGGRIFIESLGKQGQQISNRKLYDFSQEASNLILNEHVEIVEKLETKRSELTEVTTAVNQESNENVEENKIQFSNDYFEWGKELVYNLEKINIDGLEVFENNTFKIIPYNDDSEWNFYHKPTGIKIEWYKHVSSFEYINKKISYDEWQKIVQDCIKLVLKDNYIEPTKEIKLDCIVNFGNHKITENEFMEKFNKFIVDNEWSVEK